MLVAKEISKSFGKTLILNKVSLSLKEGEITVILGPSGSGKTSLLRCLCLLDNPDDGFLSIDDTDFNFAYPYSFEASKNIYPKVSIVFQQLFLWQHLTNRENISFPLKENSHNADDIVKIIDELINDLNLTDFIDKYPYQSSVGEKQRIAIARTLALKPKYILLDEITSALDIVQTNNIVKILKSISTKQNIAIMLVTHNLEVAFQVADTILYLERGTIFESGKLEILNNPKSKELFAFLGKNKVIKNALSAVPPQS